MIIIPDEIWDDFWELYAQIMSKMADFMEDSKDSDLLKAVSKISQGSDFLQAILSANLEEGTTIKENEDHHCRI